MGWYYALAGKQVGPVTDVELAQLVTAGTITAATLVWQPGQAEWKSYAEVAGLNRAADSDHAACAVSGKVRPKREMLEYEGRWVSAEHRDEFFQRLREGVPVADSIVPGAYGYAGFWIRFVAVILDRLILGVVLVPAFIIILFTMIFAAMPMSGSGRAGEPNVALILLGYGIFFLLMIASTLGYQLFCLRRWDATLGKRIMGLKVLRTNGDRLTVGRIVGRYFAYLLNQLFVPLSIGFIIAGFDAEKRALHDMICDTRVIKTRH